jgi:hypothetical protein
MYVVSDLGEVVRPTVARSSKVKMLMLGMLLWSVVDHAPIHSIISGRIDNDQQYLCI